jgi:hypothetical protein
MDKIDLEELERLAKAATPGPWVVAHLCTNANFVFAQAPDCDMVFHAREADVQYITAACNAVPELIARVRELERQRLKLADLAIYNNGCFDCPLEDVCLYKEELTRDSEVCSKLLIEWVEATKEAE